MNWGDPVRRATVAALVCLLTVAPSAAQASGTGRAAHSAVKIAAGRLAPSGTALVSGKLPASHRSKPKAYALSHNTSFGPGDVRLGSVAMHAAKGHYRAWLGLPDDVRTGHWHLLGCRKAKPTHSTCFAVGTVHVIRAPSPVVAMPVLETGRTVSHVFASKGGSLTATAADGTTYTLTLPSSDLVFPVQLTPVSSLSRTSAAGRLLDGVVISPVGDAPPGAQLVIKPARQPTAKARIVGFGGIDPSGAAYQLPIAFGKTAKIPLASFGGYGIAEPAAGASRAKLACAPARSASLDPLPTAAGSRPIVSCSSAAQRIQQLSDAIGQQIGEARQAELAGSTPAHTIEVADALTAATAAVEEEAGRVVNEPPSDEGDAELEVLTTLSLGIGRDLELLGLGDSPTSQRGTAFINQTVKYRLANLQRSCNGGGQQPAAVLLAHAMEAFAAVRQLEMLGGGDLSDQALELRAACLRRVRIQLDVADTSKVDDGQFDVKAGVTADDIEIAGRDDSTVFGGVALHAPDVNLNYGSSSVTVDPPYSTYEEAKITDTSGLIHVNNVGYSATTRIRCDKNRKFVVSHDVRLWLSPEDLWQDLQKIQISVQGSVVGTDSGAVEAGAWAEDLKTQRLPTPFHVQLGGPHKTVLKHHGKCASPCKSYSYDASFGARSENG